MLTVLKTPETPQFLVKKPLTALPKGATVNAWWYGGVPQVAKRDSGDVGDLGDLCRTVPPSKFGFVE